jgi:hypothetical protein
VSVKIVVAATRHPHALSRREVDTLLAVLPPEYTAPIREVELHSSPIHAGRFEWARETGRAVFGMVVPEKSEATTTEALELFLEGVFRIQQGAPFSERVRRAVPEAREFVQHWVPIALSAIRGTNQPRSQT